MIPALGPIGAKLARGIGEGVGALLGNTAQPHAASALPSPA